MDEHTIKCDIEMGINREKFNNIKHIVPPNPKEKQGTSPLWSPILLRRETSYGLWCTTIDRETAKINPFPICKRNKTTNTKGSQIIPYSG